MKILRRMLSAALDGVSKKSWTGNSRKVDADAFTQFELRAPHHQNAIDALPGWSSSFPKRGLKAGTIPLFQDGRVLSALEAYGSIEGAEILEVGPLEAMHTFILNGRRPANIDAIEANQSCFLRCLVTKEILKLDKASFYLGDIQGWLEETDKTYDFALASGVLYHMPDPGEFLRLLSKRAKAIFLWTHFFDDDVMPASDVRRRPFSGRVELRSVAGFDLHYHERSYQNADQNASFCGGMKDRHFWLEKNEILSLLKGLGYSTIQVQAIDNDHPGGPCFSVFARQ
ncbi:class I SAM-dependent methyltransferase [Agrobacterium pusense]|uniref:class I SAM-dependent methyltransferase n=1 Tax=Agrobacterium pusense TaxID=648995 RepID=UPI00289F0158|nr:class I SAM-dependent methyltransferase [Agrobacterium pusense]